jgi:hypothetical protein
MLVGVNEISPFLLFVHGRKPSTVN